MLPTPEIINADYERIYEPAEDSFLLLDLFEELKEYLTTKKFAHKTPLVVEVGTGSGVVITFLNQNILPNALYIATDINPYGCRTALSTNSTNATSYNFDSIRCDLVTGLSSHQVDLLVFNPPYVPSETVPEAPLSSHDLQDVWVDIALEGGPEGMDVTNKLLDDLDRILAVNGEAYILFCARNKSQQVVAKFLEKNSNFTVSQVIERKAGWEVLSVFRFHKHN